MKTPLKISDRERWIIAVGPALLLVGAYFTFYSDNLTAELDKVNKRAAAAAIPLPAAAPSATLAKAKSTLEAIKNEIADNEGRVAALEVRSRATPKTVSAFIDDRDPAHIIEEVEAVFARNGITPLVSEGANEGASAGQVPGALVSALTPKLDNASKAPPRVWHCIFDDVTPRFDKAFKELAEKAPAIVPLSMNYVYNPDNDGETRLLELWLVY